MMADKNIPILLLLLAGAGVALAIRQNSNNGDAHIQEGEAAGMGGTATFGTAPSNTGLGSGFAGVGQGVGRIEVFPITTTSVEHVEGLAYEMLRDGDTSAEVEAVAEIVLKNSNVEFEPSLASARVLHDFVNNRIPTISDPDRFEYMSSPKLIAMYLLNGQLPKYFDCDDSSVFLASLARSVGFRATVCFLDTNGNGEINHAMALINVPGEGPLYAETTIQGKPLGWVPEFATAECLAV